MRRGKQLKAGMLLMIMLLVTGHDLIPHSHHSSSSHASDLSASHHHHFHHHEHGHLPEDMPVSSSNSDDQDDDLIDFLWAQHQQIVHASQIATSGIISKSAPSIAKAALNKTCTLYGGRESFLHHYSLFDSPLLYRFSFLADFSRRGPPLFIS